METRSRKRGRGHQASVSATSIQRWWRNRIFFQSPLKSWVVINELDFATQEPVVGPKVYLPLSEDLTLPLQVYAFNGPNLLKFWKRSGTLNPFTRSEVDPRHVARIQIMFPDVQVDSDTESETEDLRWNEIRSAISRLVDPFFCSTTPQRILQKLFSETPLPEAHGALLETLGETESRLASARDAFLEIQLLAPTVPRDQLLSELRGDPGTLLAGKRDQIQQLVTKGKRLPAMWTEISRLHLELLIQILSSHEPPPDRYPGEIEEP